MLLGRTDRRENVSALRPAFVFAEERSPARRGADGYRRIFERIYGGHRVFRDGAAGRGGPKSEIRRQVYRRRKNAPAGLPDLRRRHRSRRDIRSQRSLADDFRPAQSFLDLDIFRRDLFNVSRRRRFFIFGEIPRGVSAIL